MINLGLEIVEIDGDHGFLDMEFPRHPIEAGSVPVEDAVGGIAVLLNLDDHVALAYGMEPSAGDKDAVAAFDRNDVKGLFDAAFAKQGFELLPRDTRFQARVNVGARFCVSEVPHLRLWFAAERFNHVSGRMNLHGEPFASVQQLDQDRKALCLMVRVRAPKNLLAR